MYDTPSTWWTTPSSGIQSVTGLLVWSPPKNGSITISLRKEPPGEGVGSNWLPAPKGTFRPILRMYQPRQPVFDSTYVLPRSGA